MRARPSDSFQASWITNYQALLQITIITVTKNNSLVCIRQGTTFKFSKRFTETMDSVIMTKMYNYCTVIMT